MGRQVILTEAEWKALLEFMDGWLGEIAQYDDDDEQYIAVSAVRAKLDEQLGRGQADSVAR